jgi:RNA recognition motif-containing protein
VIHRGDQESFMSQKLFIGGLPFSTSTEELSQLFKQLAGVENVAVVTDRDTGRSRGFAFVEMTTSEAADEAVRKFNGTTLGGRTLTVEIARPSAPRGDGGGGRGGGSRSGGRW